jgi:hypothetical protein
MKKKKGRKNIAPDKTNPTTVSSLSVLFQGNRKERRLQAKRLKRKMK